MGFTRRSITCFFSSFCSQWSASLHRIIVTHQQCLCQEKRYCQENLPGCSCCYDLKTLIWSRVTSMVQPGVVAAVTISVLLMKYFLTVPCRRCRAPHHCGDPDPSRTSSWITRQWPKLPPWDVASLALRRLEQQMVPTGTLQRKHPFERTSS